MKVSELLALDNGAFNEWCAREVMGWRPIAVELDSENPPTMAIHWFDDAHNDRTPGWHGELPKFYTWGDMRQVVSRMGYRWEMFMPNDGAATWKVILMFDQCIVSEYEHKELGVAVVIAAGLALGVLEEE